MFDPIRTAATGRRLEISSDARYRFERGVDPAFVGDGLEIATRLILELCGGEASEIVVAGAAPEWRREYVLRAGRPASLGGLDVAPEESARDPRSARLRGRGGGRRRSHRRAALLARRHRGRGRPRRGGAAGQGLRPHPGGPAAARHGHLAPGDRPGAAPRRAGAPHAGRARARRDGRLLVHLGARGRAVRRRQPELRLVNPISADLDAMRPSVLPAWSPRRGATPIAAFPTSRCSRLGPLYRDDTPEGQANVAAGLRAGRTGPATGASRRASLDLYHAKADALAALAAVGAPADNVQADRRPARLVPSGPRRRAAPRAEDARASSASCTRRCSRPSTRRPDRRVRGVPRRRAGAARPRCAGRRCSCRCSSRSSAISPLSSIASCRPKRCCAPRAASTASSSPKSACSTSTRAPACPRQKIARHYRHPAAAGRDPDRCRDRGLLKRLVAQVEKATGATLRS